MLFCLGRAERWGGISEAAYEDRGFGPPGAVLTALFKNLSTAIRGVF